MRKSYTAIEKAKVLTRQTLRIKDICVLFDCGYQTARSRADRFLEYYELSHGYSLYNGQIPTTEFLKYYDYDEERIEKYARLGL